MTMIGKIRRMHFRQRKTVREISLATSLSRNTVRKYLRMERAQEPKYERSPKATKLTPFHEMIVRALKADARRPKRDRRTALALFEQIRSEGYAGANTPIAEAEVASLLGPGRVLVAVSRAFWRFRVRCCLWHGSYPQPSELR